MEFAVCDSIFFILFLKKYLFVYLAALSLSRGTRDLLVVACGILPDQGSNLCPLHWQVDS